MNILNFIIAQHFNPLYLLKIHDYQRSELSKNVQN